MVFGRASRAASSSNRAMGLSGTAQDSRTPSPVLEPEVVVQVACEVLLGRRRRPVRPFLGDGAFRLRRFLEVALAFVFFAERYVWSPDGYVVIYIAVCYLNNTMLTSPLTSDHRHVASVAICAVTHAQNTSFEVASIAEQVWCSYRVNFDAARRSIYSVQRVARLLRFACRAAMSVRCRLQLSGGPEMALH